MLKSNILRLFIILVFTINAYAVREPRATSSDSRLRVLSYNPNTIFKYIGYLGYQGSIVFDEDETVETISMGDPTGWQIINSGNRLFLKPTSTNATTNMTLITNQRLYFFEMHAEKTDSIDDPGLAFQVKFLYPNSTDTMMEVDNSDFEGPDMTKLSKYNFDYTVSGADLIAPIKIFDDGVFTYFEFQDKNQPIPAFFEVLSDGQEAMVNYQVKGNYIVVLRVVKNFTLRYGKDITCVFNENYKKSIALGIEYAKRNKNW